MSQSSFREGFNAEDAASASTLLQELLARPGKYRRVWEAKIDRPGSRVINEAAVARVIAEYLWETGERPDNDVYLARRLRDRVARALTGKVLSAETLRWFIKAFEIEERPASNLMHLRSGAWRDEDWW